MQLVLYVHACPHVLLEQRIILQDEKINCIHTPCNITILSMFYLLLIVSPRFIAFPNDIELPANDRLELVCEAIGVPSPEIEWYINGSAIPSKSVQKRSNLVSH